MSRGFDPIRTILSLFAVVSLMACLRGVDCRSLQRAYCTAGPHTFGF